MLGKNEGRRKEGGQRMRWLDGITNSMDINVSEQIDMKKLQEILKDGKPGVLLSMGSQTDMAL